MHFPVLVGTVRQEAMTPHVARWVHARLARRPDVTSEIVDPATLPFCNLEVREWEMEPRPPEVARLVDGLGRADGFVLVFPEYNHGYPGALKNVLDLVYDEWNDKPFAFVTLGGVSGGLRAAENLRPVIAGLRGHVVPAALAVQGVKTAWTPEGPARDAAAWEARTDRMFDDLERYARLFKAARAAR